MNVLLYDKELGEDFIKKLSKYKELTLISDEKADNFFRENWRDVALLIDATTSHNYYKKLFKSDVMKEQLFSKYVTFYFFNNKKIIKLFSLKNFLYKKENFSEEDFKKINLSKKIIIDTLEKICGSYTNTFQQEIEELANKRINFKNVTSDKSDIFFVTNKTENLAENEIDLSRYNILKELEQILVYKI